MAETAEPELLSVRMLVRGVFPPFRDGYDFQPEGARKWVQSGYCIQYRGHKLMPTIVGVSRDIPDWSWFSEQIFRSDVTAVKGSPRYAATDLPTWYLEVVSTHGSHRVKSYGAGALKSWSSDDPPDPELVAVRSAISVIEQFVIRIPWSESVEMQPVNPTKEQLGDLF